MSHFNYVIYSESRNIFYKGYTEDVHRRLFEHNNDLGRYTAGKGPWKLIIVERFDTKREALVREKALKKCKSDYFLWLKQQPQNIASTFKNDG